MCDCLDQAEVCGVCGCAILRQEDDDGELVLTHYAGHSEPEEEGGETHSLWSLHDRESCLAQRELHWQALMDSGLGVQLRGLPDE